MADDENEVFIDVSCKEEPVETKNKVDLRKFSTLEGFESELGIFDKIIKIREDMIDNNAQDFINGRLSTRDAEVFNQIMSQLSSDVLNKVKMIKDAGIQEAKANNESALIGLAMSLIGDRSKVITELKTINVEPVKSEVKQLNSFDFIEEELKD